MSDEEFAIDDIEGQFEENSSKELEFVIRELEEEYEKSQSKVSELSNHKFKLESEMEKVFLFLFLFLLSFFLSFFLFQKKKKKCISKNKINTQSSSILIFNLD